MKVDEIRVGVGTLTGRIYAGALRRDGRSWREKRDVTYEVIEAFAHHMAIRLSDGENQVGVKLDMPNLNGGTSVFIHVTVLPTAEIDEYIAMKGLKKEGPAE